MSQPGGFKHYFGFLAAVFSALIAVENCHAVDVDTICARRDFEFSANVNMEKIGPVHLNIVCKGNGSMAASIYHPKLSPVSLTNSSQFDDVLNISQVGMGSGDRSSISSTSTFSRIHLNLEAYTRYGLIIGDYLNQNMDDYLSIRGEIPFIRLGVRSNGSVPVNGALPRVEDWPATTVDTKMIPGIYRFPIPAIVNPISGEKIPAAVGRLKYEIGDSAAMPIIYLKMETYQEYDLTEGMAWDGTGRLELSVAFNDLTPSDRPFAQIRGHFVDNKTIEFYLIDPIWGVRGMVDPKTGAVVGPFVATQVSRERDRLVIPPSDLTFKRPKLPVTEQQN